ncbi:NADPH-dependent FMN reductase [Radicibacter daui]|uniref:NADPH-dependent FMN reductase n=1 Tax=Radicibacter daui TaxID=3064829 RepID=UPI004046F515
MSHPRPIKLGILLGSLRRGSFHGAVARALPGLAPDGVTISQLPSFRDFPIYDADIQAEGIPGPVELLAEAIRSVDGVVIVTPEYNYSVPGGLKNALDWVSRLQPQPFAGKPVAIQSGSIGPIAGSRAQYHLRQIMVFLDALVLNKPEIMIGTIQSKLDETTGELSDETTRGFIGKQLEAFAAYVRKVG